MKSKNMALASLLSPFGRTHPLDLAHAFGRNAPLEVEIGFGYGEFLMKLAKENPDKDFVGLELSWFPVKRALRRLALNPVANMRLLQMDARLAFGWLFREESLDYIYSLFSYPWPKKSHHKHRLFTRSFLRLLNNRLKNHGGVLLVTDHAAYFEWLLEEATDTGFDVEKDTIGPRFATHYEQKWERGGQQEFFSLSLRKRTHQPFGRKGAGAVEIHYLKEFRPERFSLIKDVGPITVVFKDFIYDPLKKLGMVEVLVMEDQIQQHFWVTIVCTGERWCVHVSGGCGVIPTPGAQRAVDKVYEAARQTSAVSGEGMA